MKVTELALDIADEYCRSLIACYGTPILSRNGALLWYEIDVTDHCDGWLLTRALDYLDMRGQLRRRPSNNYQVKAR